ncbi:MAG: hypothetical protein NTV80_13240 [Verrucomicrobia bacterium]|nr:hypothetical protein [Verrucomicrobiota bacterium]
MKAQFRNWLLLVGGSVLAFVLLSSTFQTVFWSRDSARARALQEVTQFCLNSGRDPALLIAHREDTVGNTPWSFEWDYNGKPGYLIGVWFSHDGHPEFYSGSKDDLRSAAYDPR